MCGICGIFDMSGAGRLKNAAWRVERMMDTLAHRGPDGSGIYSSPDANCILGHKRLAIIDVAGGKQPASNEDDDIWVSFDGEIYNYAHIWKDLESRGHKFKTSSDTEAIVHLYESYGADFASQMNGMFSVAVYDQKEKRLLLTRDRCGVKPLFTAIDDNFLYFASEIKAILAVKPELKSLSEEALYEYLIYGYISAPATIFQKINKFMPAHVAVYSSGGEKYEQVYWQARYSPEYGRSAGAFANELLSTIKNAVKDRMNADVDMGAYLSGGINSSIIVALMSKISSIRIKSFTIGFDEDGQSDLKFAARVAEMFDTVHHAFNIKSREIELLPDIVSYFDEPLCDPSILPAYQSARVVSNHARVILNGEGADELFGGHERYLWETIAGVYTRVPKLLRKNFFEKAMKLFPSSTNNFFENGVRKLKRFMEYCAYDPNYRHLSFASYFSGESLRAVVPQFEKNKTAILASEKKYETDFNEGNFENWLSAVLFSDFKYYLQGSVIVKNERMGMANSVENRSPFLDYKVVELAMKMPVDYKIKNLSLKNILKVMMQDTLPLYILHRPKTGFTPPLDKWFKGDLRELLSRALTGKNSFVKNFLNAAYVKHMIETNQSGMQNFSYQLFNLFILELWHKLYMGQSSGLHGVSYKDIF